MPRSTLAGILFDVPMCASVVGVLGVPLFTTAAYDFGRMVTNTTIDESIDRSHGNVIGVAIWVILYGTPIVRYLQIIPSRFCCW